MLRNNIQGHLESRRADLQRLDSMLVKMTTISGEARIDGDGEGTTLINFPVLFQEKPIFTFGYEVAENDIVVAGGYPRVSAAVLTWVTETMPDQTVVYKGANLAVSANGRSGMRGYLHFHFQGKALMNPVNQVTTTEQII